MLLLVIGLPDTNGYIHIEANGGLHQQRTSICNAVAVAGYLNATLVIPNFHFHSIWRDPSLLANTLNLWFWISEDQAHYIVALSIRYHGFTCTTISKTFMMKIISSVHWKMMYELLTRFLRT